MTGCWSRNGAATLSKEPLMKIRKLETFCNEFVGFVRVTTGHIEDGKAIVTDASGWDVEINPTWLEKAQYNLSEI